METGEALDKCISTTKLLENNSVIKLRRPYQLHLMASGHGPQALEAVTFTAHNFPMILKARLSQAV
jgi:hypothetical protein